jgi:hypothetical protein
MKVAVWDTYVTKTDGKVMHFDIIAPEEIKDPATIYTFGKAYLLGKNLENLAISSKECAFCHVEEALPEMVAAIQQQGYYIIEMQNCA